MKKTSVIIISIICIISLSSGCSSNNTPTLTPTNTTQAEMLEITLEWGRLAPIPESKTDFKIYTEGSMFTRAFRSSFYLPEEDLNDWISLSPGLVDATIEKTGQSTSKYQISPGGGAQYAEVVIDFDSCFVETYVYWS